MKPLLSIFAILYALSISAQGTKRSVSIDSIQGAWTCVYSVYDNPLLAHEIDGPWGLSTPDKILFEGDSLFSFNYPCELARKDKIKIWNDSIDYVEASPKPGRKPKPPREISTGDWPATIAFEGDTLVVKTEHMFSVFTEKRYVRTVLDSHKVNWLRKYTLNIECLYGTWKLETAYDSGYDGNGMVDYNFPFTPQATIIFTSNSRIDYSSRVLWLKVNGVAKPFAVTNLSTYGQLDVQTMEWYKSDWPYQLRYTKQ